MPNYLLPCLVWMTVFLGLSMGLTWCCRRTGWVMGLMERVALAALLFVALSSIFPFWQRVVPMSLLLGGWLFLAWEGVRFLRLRHR